ncbi:hypothetical protein [Corynebacterium pseudopelargi]|uniref:DUF5642 domain-containing protein n=1 Tax=Corynebacterium pseudopelargi TaxID=2080757 RepID=A0A3G6IWQ7_9CORY|nr:hypothetical protein [Corynebacterium pseudopelargi]AZA10132.1 hypothetical protein CPPEL_10165 [Corynebacterium pseudopelargi]
MKMRLHNHKRSTTLLAVPFILALGLSACSSDGDNDSAETQTSTNTVTSTAQSTIEQTQAATLQEMIVGPDDAPEGLKHADVSMVNDLASELGGNLNLDGGVQPEQCQPFAADISTAAKWAALPQNEAATALYTTPDDNEAVMVRIDATETTVNPEECATFTREFDNELAKSVSTYTVTPMEISIEGADNVVAVEEQMQSMNVGGQELEVPPAGAQNVIITGTTQGKTFTVIGSNTIPKEVLQALAQNQVNKINENS